MRLRTVLATLTAGLAAATCLTAAGPAGAADSANRPAGSPTRTRARVADPLGQTNFPGPGVGQ
ncbi:hypothetical protein [Streptomyces diastatochromogenes]|uniref:hypothetical protein n=1 Tax=Streptomyces diastatochromogenes TaxID=42236 RepID=UPI00368B3C3F